MNKHFITLMLTLGFITSSVQALPTLKGSWQATKDAYSYSLGKAKDVLAYGMDKGAVLVDAVKAHPVKTAAIASGALVAGAGVTYTVKTIKKSIKTAKETKQALEEALKQNQGNEQEIAQLKAALDQVRAELAKAKTACIVAQADAAKVEIAKQAPRTNTVRPAVRHNVVRRNTARPVVRRNTARPAVRRNVARNARPAIRPAARGCKTCK